MATIKVDLTGRKFGSLTVIRYSETKKGNKRTWECICDCGNTAYYESYWLTGGRVLTCGCGKRTLFVGSTLGALTILEVISNPNGRDKYKCVCSCGNHRTVTSDYLYRSKYPVCPSCDSENRSIKTRKQKLKESGFSEKARVYRQYKHNAKSRGLAFEISFDEFLEIVVKKCNYCPSICENCSKSRHDSGDFCYTGIDRVDNAKGYTIDNCVPCCYKCNYAKRNMSVTEYEDWILSAAKTIMERNNKDG